MKRLYSYLRIAILVLLVLLITMSSHPVIVARSHNVGFENGTILSRYIVLVFALLFLLCLNVRSFWESPFIRKSILLLFLVFFAYLCTFSFFDSNEMYGDIRAIVICLIAVMIGWQLDLSRNYFIFIVLLFSALTVFVGLMQIRTNIGGFVIEDQYLTQHKNALGAMLATSLIIFILVFINTKRTHWWRWLFVGMAVLTFVVMLTTRARSAVLASIIVSLFIFYLKNKKAGRNFLVYIVMICALVGLIILILPSGAKDFIYSSFTQNQGDDITSGRMWRNIAAIDFILEHPLFGNLNQGYHIAQIHNFPLITMYKYGLLFALPIMIIYIMIVVYAVKKSIQYKHFGVYSIGFITMLVPYIISMAEPTMPFGPGTAMIFNFLLFGIALRQTFNTHDTDVTCRPQ